MKIQGYFRNLDLLVIGLIFIAILVYQVPDDAPIRNGLLTQMLAIVFMSVMPLAIGAYASRKIFPHARPHYFIKDISTNSQVKYEVSSDYWKACLLRMTVMVLPFIVTVSVLVGTG